MLYYISDLSIIKSKISLNFSLSLPASISLKKYSHKSPTSGSIYLVSLETKDLIYSESGVCESSNFSEILSKLNYFTVKSLILNVISQDFFL